MPSASSSLDLQELPASLKADILNCPESAPIPQGLSSANEERIASAALRWLESDPEALSPLVRYLRGHSPILSRLLSQLAASERLSPASSSEHDVPFPDSSSIAFASVVETLLTEAGQAHGDPRTLASMDAALVSAISALSQEALDAVFHDQNCERLVRAGLDASFAAVDLRLQLARRRHGASRRNDAVDAREEPGMSSDPAASPLQPSSPSRRPAMGGRG